MAPDKHHRDAIRSGDGRVEPQLPKRLSIETHVLDRAREGVADGGYARAGAAVHADEHGSIVVGTNTVHHAPGSGLPADQPRPGIELFEHDVAKRAMRVGDDHLGCRLGIEDACHHRARFPGHEPACPLVLRIAGIALLDVDDTGNPLDVDKNKDLRHGCASPQACSWPSWPLCTLTAEANLRL